MRLREYIFIRDESYGKGHLVGEIIREELSNQNLKDPLIIDLSYICQN